MSFKAGADAVASPHEDDALFTEPTRRDDLIAWAQHHGVEPAAALLAAALSCEAGEGAAAFAASFTRAARRGGAPAGTARTWLFWLWQEAPVAIADRLPSDADRQAADQVMAMHRRALDGAVIDAAEWRAARRTFQSALQSQGAAAAKEALLASMWDLRNVPGAIADVAGGWIRETATMDALEPAGWTWSEYSVVQSAWDAFGIAYSSITRADDEDDASFQARRQRYMQDHPPAIDDDGYAKLAVMNEARSRLSADRADELRAGLLQIVAP